MKRNHYIVVLFLFSVFSFLLLRRSAFGGLMRDISLSIFSSSLFALLIELGFWLNDRTKLGYLNGRWERLKFFNRNMKESGQGYDDISDRYSTIPKEINLAYKGEGEYAGTAVYEEGKLSFSLTINRESILRGSGTYQYEIPKSQAITADIGHYTFFVDKKRDKIYISHQNVLPSGTAKGLEIWQRKNTGI